MSCKKQYTAEPDPGGEPPVTQPYTTMTGTSSRLRHLRSLAASGDRIRAVQACLDFLRHVGNEYERLEVYNDTSHDGDDFGTREVEKLLAGVLRDDATPVETVRAAADAVAELRKMPACAGYGLVSFDEVDEAVSYRTADADTYLSELDRRIGLQGREYLRIMEDGGDTGTGLTLHVFDDLGDSLLKKIGYLRQSGRTEDADAVIRKYGHVPAVRSLVINERMATGDYVGALAAIDEGIGVYGDDGYASTAEWHRRKISLLERKGDVKGVVEEYRRLFRQFLSDKKAYLEKLKALVPPKEWREFATGLFRDIPHVTDGDCVLICDLIVKEGLHRCLAGILMANGMSFRRSEIFAKYAGYLTREEQSVFVRRVIADLRARLGHAKSKSYAYIVEEMGVLHDSCPAGKELVSEFAGEVAARYGNRPALLGQLASRSLLPCP